MASNKKVNGITRTKDPAGIEGTHVHIEPDCCSPEDAFKNLFAGLGPSARLSTLKAKNIASLQNFIIEAEQWLAELGGKANFALLSLIKELEYKATYFEVAPKVIRDNKRQEGTRKGRSSQTPVLDSWIAQNKNLELTAKELWRKLDEADLDDLYIDGDRLIETSKSGKEKEIKYKTFENRLSAARKNPS